MILVLNIATIDFSTKSISWNFCGYSEKADKAIRQALEMTPTQNVSVYSIARIFNLYDL